MVRTIGRQSAARGAVSPPAAIPSFTTGLIRDSRTLVALSIFVGTFPEFPVFLVGTAVWRNTCPIPRFAAGRQTTEEPGSEVSTSGDRREAWTISRSSHF